MTDNTESELKHYSDCATHNEPAYPNGPCDCGGYYSEAWPQELLEWAEQTGAINPHVSWYSELTYIITKAVEEARKQERREIVEIAKSMTKEWTDTSQAEDGIMHGYNQCVSDIIQNLTNKE